MATVAKPAGTTRDDAPVDATRVYRLSVAQYHAMGRAGILGGDDSVELLEGWLVTKRAKNPPHVVATELLQATLTGRVPGGWYVSMQNPVTTDESEPEPDAKVVRGRPRDYAEKRVGPGDVALVVEVADTSLVKDQTTKQRIYARAGIPVYWIVNLVANCLEIYTDPTGPSDQPTYRSKRVLGSAESAALTLGGVDLEPVLVGDVLP